MPCLLDREQTGELYYQEENISLTRPGSRELNPTWTSRHRYSCLDVVYESLGYINDFDEEIVVMTFFDESRYEEVFRVERNFVNLGDIYIDQPIKLQIIKSTFMSRYYSRTPFIFVFQGIHEELHSSEEVRDEVERIHKEYPDIDWELYD